MPTLPLHLSPAPAATEAAPANPLPSLLHTPLGLALLELQGTINTPPPTATMASTPVGTLTFPADFGPENKRVYMHVGANQRMVGELKKLGTPLGVLRRRTWRSGGTEDDVVMQEPEENRNAGRWDGEELEVAEVIRWKLVFAGRPEPVGSTPAAAIVV